ncbi:hypothetical protein [Mesorhizobium sp. M1406]|uniref:hypothetical protein n=1 Tax=Mesorhizobium sp. M1406 TaxID=2957099 RepID=UPI00333A32E6
MVAAAFFAAMITQTSDFIIDMDLPLVQVISICPRPMLVRCPMEMPSANARPFKDAATEIDCRGKCRATGKAQAACHAQLRATGFEDEGRELVQPGNVGNFGGAGARHRHGGGAQSFV